MGNGKYFHNPFFSNIKLIAALRCRATGIPQQIPFSKLYYTDYVGFVNYDSKMNIF